MFRIHLARLFVLSGAMFVVGCNTCSDRPSMFSRFRTPKEIKVALTDLAEGKVDIAIGTHRLFSKDVVYRDLGLVLVDEEQRFGVKSKRNTPS